MPVYRRTDLIRRSLAVAAGVTSLVLLSISLLSHGERLGEGRYHHHKHRSNYQVIRPFDEFNGDGSVWSPRPPVAGREDPRTPPAAPPTSNNAVTPPHAKNGTEQPTTEPYVYEDINVNQTRPPAVWLTLFTTLKDNDNRWLIHNNTMTNWAALMPYVQPVLFIDNTTRSVWVERAQELGWHINNVTKTNKGIPILKHMFIQAMKEYTSPFYGYANADLLFDESLVENLDAFVHLKKLLQKMVFDWETNQS